jgi:serine/threonine protein kinase
MEDFPQIPGYTIIKKIGEGATALVFLGSTEGSDRKVAIKVLRSVLQEKEEYSYRFLREARIVKKLKHPNIIKIYEVGQPGNYYIVMEYLEDSLSDRINRKRDNQNL